MSKIFTLGRTITGKTPSTKVKENWGNDIPFYAPEDIAKGYILDDAIRHVSNQGFNAIKNNTTDGISVLVGCIGSDMGNSAIVERKCAFNQQINAITDFDKDVNPFYVYYYLSTQKDYLRQLAGSTTTPLLPKSDFEQIDIPLPDKYTQDKTVRVLKPIDDKIKNNTAICSDLESMAKLLYDYWFVQFDFPDENGKPYKSSGGKMVWNEELKREIPDGWEVSTLKGKHDIKRGISYTSKDIESGDGTPMINLACIDIKRNYRDGEIKYYNGNVTPENLLSPNDLLIACTDLTRNADIVGSPILTPNDGNTYTFSMDIAKLIPNEAELNPIYLYMALRTEYYHKYIKRWASGTNVLHLDLTGLDWYKMWFPPKALQDRFADAIISFEERKHKTMVENQELASLRDFLLPMLMNGQVKVKKEDDNE